ncbi:T9SS type A sorting domain-containing protein [uncultured Fluviicola sp.]|uniref:T9SS type A sorting domain-containing protein n=1 Tax=uncultured Fluviicola sp. TaxID=463303 RepID=UPI0025E746F5|nr:T9SS type A sorting domain-containing protein [uncultured Fluviicola sp.]
MPASFKSFLIGLFLCLTTFTHAQWNHQTLFTQHLDINCIAKDPTNSFCVAGAFNLFKNTGSPASWTNITNNTNNFFKHNSVIVYDNNHILSVGKSYSPYSAGVMFTYNGGANWTNISLGNVADELTDVARNGSTLVAVGTWGKIYRSTNDGATWSSIPSGTTTDFHTVCYNPALNQWYIGGYNKKLTSFDNGLSYTSATVPGEIFDISYENGFLLETTYIGYTNAIGTHSTVVKKTGTGSILNTYVVPFSVNTTDFLPDGNLLTAGTKFAVLSAVDNSILVSPDSIHNLSSSLPEHVNEMVFLNSVGYAVGPDGALGYRSLPFISTYYVPATFYLSEDHACAGEPFTAIALNSNADSYQWYFDSNLISTNDTLNHFFDPAFGNHTISLVTNYQGVKDSISKSSYTEYSGYLNTTFNLNFPDTVCYGTSANGTFHNTTAYAVDRIRIRTTTNVLNNLVNPASQNGTYSVYLANLTAADTVFVEYTQHNACGDTLVSVYPHPVFVYPQTSGAFSVTSSQPTYCFPADSIQFQVVSNLPGINYTIKNNNYIPGSAFPTTTTLNPPTVSTVGTSTFQLPNNSVFYPDYGAEIYAGQFGTIFQYTHPEYINKIAIEIVYNGCPSQTFELASFTVQNPHAMFHHTFGTQINDTVEIFNDQINAAQTWSGTISNGFMNQLSDTVPIMGSYQSGEEQITLINESSYGCSDTITKTHTFLDPVANDTSLVYCFDKEFQKMTVVGSMVDEDDNLYEYGYAQYGLYSTAIIRKISSYGTILWQKALEDWTQNASNRFTAGAIDSLGNTYFARLTNTFAAIYVFDSYGNQLGGPPTSNNLEISEIIVDDSRLLFTNRLGVHVYAIQYTPNLSFSLIQSFPTYIQGLSGNNDHFFLKKIDHDNFIYAARTMNYSIEINGFTAGPYPYLGTMLVGAKLSLSSGFSNQKVLATTTVGNVPLIHSIALDTQNNCYFLVSEFTYGNQELEIMDSIIYLGNGPFKSFLVKTDDEFNLLSLTETNLLSGKIEYWKDDQFLLSGISYDGLKLKRTNNFQSLKNAVSSHAYGLGIATLDTTCSLVKGTNLGLSVNYLYPVVNANSNNIYVSVKNFNLSDTILLPFNGEVVPIDSSFVLKMSTNNCLTQQDTFEICNSDNSFYLNYASQMDSIAYTIHANGVSNSGYFPIENNLIIGSAPNPNNGFTLELFNPQNTLIDSFNYVIKQMYYPDIDSLYTLECQPGLSVYLSDPGITNYEWNFNGSITSGQSFYVSTSGLTLNIPVTVYLTTQDFQGCFGTQEFEVLKLTEAPVTPNLPANMDLICGYPLQLYVDTNSFQNIEWTIFSNQYTNNPLYIPANAITTNGYFTVYINGEDMSGCAFTDQILVDACSNLSLEENELEITVYPNPGRDYLMVDLSADYAEIDLQLTDLNGKVVLTQHTENTHFVRIYIEDLARGYYLLTGKLNSGISIAPISILKD